MWINEAIVQSVSNDLTADTDEKPQRDLRFTIDGNLPPWARRTNPIVRRHLGQFWRVMPLQASPYIKWYLIQAAVVFLTIPFDFLFMFILPLTLISLGVLPFALIYYGRTLYDLANDSSQAMVAEIENATMPILRMTMIDTREILLSKAAGALWRQSDPLAILLSVATFAQLPTIMLLYVNAYPLEEHGILAQVLVSVVFGVSIIRLPLEMFMVTAIGQYIGLTTRGKGTAAASTLSLVIFYFALLNAPRLVTLSLPVDIVVNMILPIVLPIIIAFYTVRMTRFEIED